MSHPAARRLNRAAFPADGVEGPPQGPMMPSLLAAALFVAAATCSLGASAVLVARLERLGARLGLSEALLGLAAALAADTPEVTSAVTALANGQHDIGTGVVLGSNVFNLAALIGLGAVAAGGINLHRRVVTFEGTMALWVAALSIAAVISLITAGAALALALAVLAPYVYVSAVHPSGRSALPLPPRLRAWLAEAVAEEEQELSGAIRAGKGGPRDAAIAGADQGQLAAVNGQDPAGREQPEVQQLVPGQHSHHQAPGGDERDEQKPGEPVAGLVAQREPPRGRELGEHWRPPGSRGCGGGGGKVSGWHGRPPPTARGGLAALSAPR